MILYMTDIDLKKRKLKMKLYINIVEKLTEAQKNAKKYYMYGGSITEFSNMEEAQKHADQIER